MLETSYFLWKKIFWVLHICCCCCCCCCFWKLKSFKIKFSSKTTQISSSHFTCQVLKRYRSGKYWLILLSSWLRPRGQENFEISTPLDWRKNTKINRCITKLKTTAAQYIPSKKKTTTAKKQRKKKKKRIRKIFHTGND